MLASVVPLALFAVAECASDQATCNSTATSIAVAWTDTLAKNASLFELQLWLDAETAGVAQTAAHTALRIRDLRPATTYWLATRSCDCDGDVCRWSTRSKPWQCSTLALASGQARVLPPAAEPTATAVHVQIEPPANASGRVAFLLQYRDEASEDINSAAAAANDAKLPPPPPWSEPIRVDATRWTLDGLSPGRSIEVRVTALLPGASIGQMQPGPSSDPTSFSTADPSWAPLRGYRVSELCGASCEPDYLTDHDMGDLATVVGYLVIDDIAFNSSVAEAESRTRAGHRLYTDCDPQCWPA